MPLPPRTSTRLLRVPPSPPRNIAIRLRLDRRWSDSLLHRPPNTSRLVLSPVRTRASRLQSFDSPLCLVAIVPSLFPTLVAVARTLPCLVAIAPSLDPAVPSLVPKCVTLVPLSLVAVPSAVILLRSSASLIDRPLNVSCALISRDRVALVPACLSLNRRPALDSARPAVLRLVAVRRVSPAVVLVAAVILLSRRSRLVRLFLKAPIVLRVLLALVRVPIPIILRVLCLPDSSLPVTLTVARYTLVLSARKCLATLSGKLIRRSLRLLRRLCP